MYIRTHTYIHTYTHNVHNGLYAVGYASNDFITYIHRPHSSHGVALTRLPNGPIKTWYIETYRGNAYLSLSLFICVCVYIYIYTHMYTYEYIHNT